MTTTAWPYPSVADPAWLAEASRGDRFLAACRRAVLSLVPRRGRPAGPEDLLDAVTAARELAERVDWVLLSLVGEARAAGLSWEQVARALGVTKQAAHQRFGPYVAEALARAGAPAESTVPAPRAPGL